MTEPELKGPIKAVHFVHRAILKEGQDFQEVTSMLDPDDQQGATELNNRLAAFERILKTHEDSEDLTLFPPLEARFPDIADTYEFDHNRHRGHAAALSATLSDLVGAQGGRRKELVKRLGEQAILFNGFMTLHIDKENELLFPTYDEVFSAEEQQAHGKAAEGRVSQQEMAAAGAWMFQRLDIEDREGFLTEMRGMLPSEAFAGMTQGLMRAIPASDWEALVRRMPGLGSMASRAH
ncbi:MAG: hypothetical protein GEU75_04005 [Dehalococcoidia bacterium]|nr:hypothetical protein [Dehalococcoidia bacterium]